MARGGLRPGAGRPKGARSIKETKIPKDIKRAARKAKQTPLEYMLGVMNDISADDARRDRMAVAAAPYTHSRAGDGPGKKQAVSDAAKATGDDVSWGDDLAVPMSGARPN